MVMTATEQAHWPEMSERERRAVRRRIAEELSERDANANPASTPIAASSPREHVLLGARQDLEAFERGDDDLMGMPRQYVDFPRAYASIDQALASTTHG